MVRRVIGASSAPTPDFSPFRAVTPAAGLTSFFRQPGTMSIPESEFTQVAQALQSISPTLNKVIGDQAEAANRAAADQGRLDAEKLTAEQARDAMQANFARLEKDKVIPQGASPFRLAAMQAALGKDLIENELRTELNNPATINRLTDPLKKEDPAKLVSDLFADKTQGLAFYAQSAAVDALDAVETAFLNKVSLLKGQKTMAKNRDDFANSVFTSLSDNDLTDMQKVAKVQQELDKHYALTGESGVKEVLAGMRSAAMALAKDGKGIEARAIIEQMRGLSIGGTSLGERSSRDLQTLEESVHDASEIAERDEDVERDRSERRQRQAVTAEANRIMYDLLKEGDETFRKTEFSVEALKNGLMENQNLSDAEAETGAAELFRKLDALQKQSPIEPETLKKVIGAIHRLPYDQAVEVLTQNAAVLGDKFGSLYEGLERRKGETAQFDIARGAVRPTNSVFLSSFQAGLEQLSNLSVADRLEAERDFLDKLDDLLQQAVQGENDQQEIRRKYEEAGQKLVVDTLRAFETSTDKDIPESASPFIRGLVERDRLRQQQQTVEEAPQEARPGILEVEAPGLLNLFTRRSVPVAKLERLQEGTQSEEDQQKDKATLRSGAVKILSDMAKGRQGPLARFFIFGGRKLEDGEGVPDGLVREEILLRALVVGFDLDEIKTGKTKFGTPIPKTADGSSILNPRHTLLFPGLTSLKDAEDFFKQDQKDGYRRVEAVMRALPPQYRTGLDKESVETFIRLQKNHIKLYLPSSNQEQ